MDCNMETMTSNDPEDIVISGIAGRFPGSHNVKHLQENLFNKVDLGTDDDRRWSHGKIYVIRNRTPYIS